MGMGGARVALRRARRDRLRAVALVVDASVRIRIAKGRLGMERGLARWRKRARKRLAVWFR